MAMQLKYNAAGQPYLVAQNQFSAAGNTVGPAPVPNLSPLAQQVQARAKAAGGNAAARLLGQGGARGIHPVAVPGAPDAAGDPIGRFLDYDFGAGVKMKFALPVFMLVLVALRGRRR